MARFIFVTGGVVSSLGKGLLSASLGALLQARGYKVRIRKFDPYLNVDPGTMSPYQHGEVYVTDDGAETDLDLGHYERFTGVSSQPVGQYHHRPHLPRHHRQGAARRLSRRDRPGHPARHQRDQGIRARRHRRLDFVICEIGGTVGDIESLPFIELIRQLRNDLGRDQTVSVHTTLVPWIAAAGELKTKPTQQSVRELSSLGVQPEVLLCRCDRPLPEAEREKIALFCNVRKSAVIPALDARNIYDVPLQYHEAGLDDEVLYAFGIDGCAAARSRPLARDHGPHRPLRQRGDDRRRRQICRPSRRLQEPARGAGPRRHRQPRQGQHPVDRRRAVRASRSGRRRRARAAARHPRSRRVRRARQRGQDRLGQVRPRARDPLLRHLPRHADGVHRGRAEPRRVSAKPRPPSSAKPPSRSSA